MWQKVAYMTKESKLEISSLLVHRLTCNGYTLVCTGVAVSEEGDTRIIESAENGSPLQKS